MSVTLFSEKIKIFTQGLKACGDYSLHFDHVQICDRSFNMNIMERWQKIRLSKFHYLERITDILFRVSELYITSSKNIHQLEWWYGSLFLSIINTDISFCYWHKG